MTHKIDLGFFVRIFSTHRKKVAEKVTLGIIIPEKKLVKFLLYIIHNLFSILEMIRHMLKRNFISTIEYKYQINFGVPAIHV